jgi:hypothetical protein
LFAYLFSKFFCLAAEAIDNIFFVGIQEAYDISVQVLLRELQMDIKVSVLKERDQGNTKLIARQKKELKENKRLMSRVNELNQVDHDLYALAVAKFCYTTSKYPDLLDLLRSTTKVQCPALLR